MVITSPANERLKHARRVREGREPELIFVEGERLIEECLHAGLPLHACFYIPEPSARAARLLNAIHCEQFAVSEAVMQTLSDTVNPQGLVVLAERPHPALAKVLEHPSLLVALDAVQDPGNAGTILRTSEAAAATGLIALHGTVDLFAPKVLRSAMGSAFRLPVAADVIGSELLAQCAEQGICTVAATLDAELDYDEFDWRQPVLLLLGNEGNGVTPALLDRVAASVRIPLHPTVESLNVAAAAAVILFEAARQRRTAGNQSTTDRV